MKRPIQKSIYGHNPIEDSIAAMELVLLKLQEGRTFGDVILSQSTEWKNPAQDIVLKAVTREVFYHFLTMQFPVTLWPEIRFKSDSYRFI